ncbi:MAG: hypothetical protein E7447_02740 [Ruminococcaceae bacterium]|nr:hypothetical protein [Oscillospiraceae bacterium]
MSFWKRHPLLRRLLIALFFTAGVGLVVMGWSLTGLPAGLGWMLMGILSLLLSLLLYNLGF